MDTFLHFLRNPDLRVRPTVSENSTMLFCRPPSPVYLATRVRMRLGVILAILAVGRVDPVAAGGPRTPDGNPPASVGEAKWVRVAPGVLFALVRAGRYCRSGSPELAVVRLDPARIRIEPFHESEFPPDERSGIKSWQARLGATVVVNAGLYTEDRDHLGTFRRGGKDIGGVTHRSWNGLLVFAGSEEFPVTGGGDRADARILDLSIEADREIADFYPNAVQSMMLLDRTGEIRVRRTERIAPRTVVAELQTGQLLIVVTEGSYTLWEMGALLRESEWGVVEAMALDGGSESNLVVVTEAPLYETGGGNTDFRYRLQTKLPGVIAVWPSSAKRPWTDR